MCNAKDQSKQVEAGPRALCCFRLAGCFTAAKATLLRQSDEKPGSCHLLCEAEPGDSGQSRTEKKTVHLDHNFETLAETRTLGRPSVGQQHLTSTAP